jgi:hypothetical protein
MGSRVGLDVSENRKFYSSEKKERKMQGILMEEQSGGKSVTRKCAVCSEVTGTGRQRR